MAAMFDRDGPSCMKKLLSTVVCIRKPWAVKEIGAAAWLRSQYENHVVIGGGCLPVYDRVYAQMDRIEAIVEDRFSRDDRARQDGART